MTLQELSQTPADGNPLESTELTQSVATAMRTVYAKNGFVPPWIGYWALRDGHLVGTCGYKSPPLQQQVEIAYFTFPEFEGCRIATWMAGELVRKAQTADANLMVIAHTLPEENASARILRRLGFALRGMVYDPVDGDIWRWELPPQLNG